MSTQRKCRSIVCFVVATLTAASGAGAAAATDAPTPIEVRGGTAAFDAATNVSAISIHGKSGALEGRAIVRWDGAALVIERLEASVPVKSLNTGMTMRDEHMRKYVFTAEDGQLPDLRFAADAASCSGPDAQRSCELAGELAVRGISKPFTITLKVSKDGSGFRASGDGIVRLSAYSIPPPSQLGVKVVDDVKLHVEFVARPAAAATRSTR